jgi:hypothetical protein
VSESDEIFSYQTLSAALTFATVCIQSFFSINLGICPPLFDNIIPKNESAAQLPRPVSSGRTEARL